MREIFEALTPSRLEALAPELGIGRPRNAATSPLTTSGSAFADSLYRRGWFDLPLVPAHECERLVDAIERLRTAGLPLVAVYVFDEPWSIAATLQDRIRSLLGEDYELIEDLWAFRVPPGEAGWKPHRGVYERLDRSRPEYLNTWIALSDAGVDRACMTFVPLDDDPGYARGSLQDVALDPSSGVPAPVARGTALVWNANTLHWGGACSPTAAGPRYSITFTFRRADTTARTDLGDVRIVKPDAFAPWERLDAIARQLLIYGDADPYVTEAARAWARTTVHMTEVARRP